MKRGRDPVTSAEWQEAVDAAAAARALAGCKMYGLLEGGPDINVGRCDDILERGQARGVWPSKAVAELALEYIAALNAEAEEALREGGGRKLAGNAEA